MRSTVSLDDRTKRTLAYEEDGRRGYWMGTRWQAIRPALRPQVPRLSIDVTFPGWLRVSLSLGLPGKRFRATGRRSGNGVGGGISMPRVSAGVDITWPTRPIQHVYDKDPV